MSAAYESCTFGMPCFDANASARLRSRAATAPIVGFADVAGGLDHGRRRDAGRAEDSDPNRAHPAHCKVGLSQAATHRAGVQAQRHATV